jgi:DNA repair protein RAD16
MEIQEIKKRLQTIAGPSGRSRGAPGRRGRGGRGGGASGRGRGKRSAFDAGIIEREEEEEEEVEVDADTRPARGHGKGGRGTAAAGPNKGRGKKKETKDTRTDIDDEDVWGPWNDSDTEEIDPESLVRNKVFKEAATPEGLLMPLLPFQKEFLAWALDQERGLIRGGILADEMGRLNEIFFFFFFF